MYGEPFSSEKYETQKRRTAFRLARFCPKSVVKRTITTIVIIILLPFHKRLNGFTCSSRVPRALIRITFFCPWGFFHNRRRRDKYTSFFITSLIYRTGNESGGVGVRGEYNNNNMAPARAYYHTVEIYIYIVNYSIDRRKKTQLYCNAIWTMCVFNVYNINGYKFFFFCSQVRVNTYLYIHLCRAFTTCSVYTFVRETKGRQNRWCTHAHNIINYNDNEEYEKITQKLNAVGVLLRCSHTHTHVATGKTHCRYGWRRCKFVISSRE